MTTHLPSPMLAFSLLLTSALAAPGVVDLTPDNWDAVVTRSDRSVFVKFFAPWCGHCKKLEPTWERLGEAELGRVTIARVDCTGAGKPLCERHEVRGYPTLKTFWKTSVEDYAGARDYDTLDRHVRALKPMCTVEDPTHCDAAQRAAIDALRALDSAALQRDAQELRDETSRADEAHAALLATLQKQFADSNARLDELKRTTRARLAYIDAILAERPATKA